MAGIVKTPGGRIETAGGGVAVARVLASGLAAPALELPASSTEIGQQVQDFITATHDPMIVWQDPVQADDPASNSKNRLPTASDQIVIHASGKLIVPNGVTLEVDFLRVDGVLEVQPGGKVIYDTIYVMPGGSLIVENPNLSPIIELQCRNDADIDVARDPHLVSRGIVVDRGGEVRVRGKPRQRLLPLTDATLPAGSTQVTLGHPIFISTALTPTHEDLPFDWRGAGVDMVVIKADDPRGWGGGQFHGFENDLNAIQAVNGSAGASAFATNDPDGVTLDLAAPTKWPHDEYRDPVARAKLRSFGPPSGSHDNWVARPHLMMMTRSIVFTVTTPANEVNGNVHRCAQITNHSMNFLCEWAEFQTGWNRTDGRIDELVLTVLPGTNMPYAPTTNLRMRCAINLYRCGFNQIGAEEDDEAALAAFAEGSLIDGEWRHIQEENGVRADYQYDAAATSGDVAPTDQTGGTGFWIKRPEPIIRGCAFWGGTVGSAFHNNEKGHGSRGGWITTYETQARIEQNNFHNSNLSAIINYSEKDTGIWLMNAAAEVYGDGGGVVGTSGVKVLSHYSVGDGGREGSAYFQFGREIKNIRNLAYGCHARHLNVLARFQSPGPLESIYSREFNDVYRWMQEIEGDTTHHAPLLYEGAYATGCGGADFVSKTNGKQLHGEPSRVENNIYISNWEGFSLEYVWNYFVRRVAVAAPFNLPDPVRSPGLTGIGFGQKAAAISAVQCYVANYQNGVELAKSWEGQNEPADDAWDFHTVNLDTDGVTNTHVNHRTDERHDNVPENPDGSFQDESFGLTLDPVGVYTDALQETGVPFTGQLSTAIGALAWPLGGSLPSPEVIRLGLRELNGRLVHGDTINGHDARGGFWSDGSLTEGNFVLFDFRFYNPLTGASRRVFHPVESARTSEAPVFPHWKDDQGDPLPAIDNGAGDFTARQTTADAVLASQ